MAINVSAANAYVVPLILHYAITAHGDIMEISLASVKRKKVNTIQKELLKNLMRSSSKRSKQWNKN